MPEINSINYEDIEDLNKYLYDNYNSIENLELTKTGTGIFSSNIFELIMETGSIAGSFCMLNYNIPYFNPLYAEAVWKCYMENSPDSFVFFGVKETLAVPTLAMVESHAGFMISGGKIYASVADGYTQQRVEIVGIDLTRVQNYKVAYDKFYIQPLPVIEQELGLPTVYSIDRKWKLITSLTNFPPINQVHYIVQYIKNNVGANQKITFNRFIYKEVYAD